MAGLLAFVAFAFAIGGVVMAVVGVRWLKVDAQLDASVETQVVHAGILAAPPRFMLRLPIMFSARGRDLTEIEEKLRAAGYFEASAVEVFVGLRMAAALAVAGASLLAAWYMTGNPFGYLFATFALTGLTYIAAKYVLRMRAGKRELVLTVEFPFLLDLMLMMLESGVSLDQCFRGIARDERVAVPNHSKLIAMLVDDLDRGQDYQIAFDRWAVRVGVQGSRELSALFRQSLYHGMELVPALREFIREFSGRRITRAREQIGKITVRMVGLMLIFFMPALFIVLGGPPVAAIFDTLRGTGQ